MFGLFDDRQQTGRALARELEVYRNRSDVVVLALPRGGVPVGFEVATALEVPLDVLPVRKLGTPGQEELAMGAIAAGGVRIVNDDVVEMLGIPQSSFDAAVREQQGELDRRALAYRGGQAAPMLDGRTVILVDDGLATGATMRVAVLAVRKQQAGRVVVAVPVAPAQTIEEFGRLADEVVCLRVPDPFYAVACHYLDFPQVSDVEVRELLERGRSLNRSDHEPTHQC